MNRILKLISMAFAAAVFFACKPVPSELTLTSPDGRIVLTVNTDASAVAGGDLAYSLTFNGEQIMTPSAISMTLKDGVVLAKRDDQNKGFTVRKAIFTSQTETIQAPLYRQSSFTESYNELLLVCKEN